MRLPTGLFSDSLSILKDRMRKAEADTVAQVSTYL